MELSTVDKIYGLSKIWMESKYNFPYWYKLTDLNWDREYIKHTEEVLTTKNTREYYMVLLKFISLLNDGHSNIILPEKLKEQVKVLPFEIRLIKNKYYILNSTINNLNFSQLKEINNIKINDFLKKIRPYCWNKIEENTCKLYSFMIPFILGTDSFKVTTCKGNFNISCIIKNDCEVKEMECSEKLNTIYETNDIRVSVSIDNIYIIKIRSFADLKIENQFTEVIEMLTNASKIIIDVRDNIGGYSKLALDFCMNFMEPEFYGPYKGEVIHKSLEYASANQISNMKDDTIKRLIDSGITTPENVNYYKQVSNKSNINYSQDIYKNIKKQRIVKPLVVLTSRNTISAAEDFISYFKINSVGTIIGENTYGSTGTPLIQDLPGGGSFRVCTRAYKLTDEQEFINIGIKPDIYCFPDINSFKKNIDCVLNKALSYLRS